MSESNLFEGTVIYVIGNVEQKTLDILKNGRANITMFSKDSATHFIVGKTYDESQILEAKELYEKPTVNEQWVMNSQKLGKLLPVKAYDPLMASKFFQNCIFTMNQVDAQDRLKLYAMITMYGGTVQKDLDNKVTHLIAGTPQSIAIKVATRIKNKVTIITPDWIQQCLRAKRMIESEPYHPSLLNLPGQTPMNKITLMPTIAVGDKTQVMRGSVQTNLRPARPVVQMQHTPQQINEIIQSQIQQQQLQEKAKQRAAAAAAATGTGNTIINSPQVSQQQVQQVPLQQAQSQLAQSLSKPITITSSAPITTTAQTDANNAGSDQNQQIQQNQPQVTQVLVQQQQPQLQQQSQAPAVQQQIVQQVQQQQPPQNIQNVSVQQQQQIGNQGQQTGLQRQLSLQQIEATRNQKIQLISQQLQQSTNNQQVLTAQQQQQQFQQKQFQNQQQQQQMLVQQNSNMQQQQQQVQANNNVQTLNIQQNSGQIQAQVNVPQQQQQGNNIVQQFSPMKQVVNQNVQQQMMNQQQVQQQQQQTSNIQTMNIQQAGGHVQAQGNVVTQQQQQQQPQQGGNVVQQFSPMKQVINQQQMLNQQQVQQQQQQFVVNQGNLKSIAQGQGNNFIQIIQQGQNQQIVQIQNPETGQMQQKVITNQAIHANQQNVVQSINHQGNQNVQINQQQFQQTTQAQQNINIQNQNNRQQNIVIINQVQNSQQVIQNQRIQNPNQMKPQQQQAAGQQIIQQKIIATPGDQNQVTLAGNLAAQQQQNPQIIQVHQTPIGGASVQQQQNVTEIIDQKIQPTANIVHIQGPAGQQIIQQQGPAVHAGLTQAQAVQQIAQQLQSGSAEIISNNLNQQNINQQQQQMNPGINIAQQQNIGGNPSASPQIPQSPQQSQQQQQWIPQSPTQSQAQSPVIQQTVQHHIITTNQGTAITGGQFIRATTGSRMDTHIYLDAQSSAQFQKMDQFQKKEYLEKLHIQQQHQQRGNVMFSNVQPRANAPNVIAGARPHHIVIRSQMPTGLTPQQQMQWIQQNRQRQFVIRPGAPGTQQQIAGQPGQALPNQCQIDPNATPQQQQLLRQQQQQNFQRLQQLQQQNQKIQGQQTAASPRGPNFVSNNEQIEGIQIDPSNKTKTALANMLSNRLGNNGGVPQIVEQSVEPSASGTLRMMTAQHNASLVPGMPPGVVRSPQEMIVLQQQQQQQQQQQIPSQIVGNQQIVQGHPQMQQRRQLGNITNASGKPQVIVTNQVQSNQQIMISTNQNANMKSPVAVQFSPGRAPAITNRPQFYGHNPNLKLPPDLFLLGCHFFIVEYTETHADEIPGWQQIIKHHGGEIESCYNARVTHVLCRSQKHGIVMQAIRDNKRCVTVYWLNDIILKKAVFPPEQAIHLPSPSIFGNMKPGTKHIITTMGFEGDEKERVKRMIEESGAKSTPYMNRQNTVVVCKKIDQNHKKFLHAKEFNIPMVNLVWLSDLLMGNISAISQYDSPKYQQFSLQMPFRIDLAVVMPLMSSWKAPINLTQESHERLKRSQLEPSPQKAKKMRTIPFLEVISDEINCIRQPEPNNIPIVMFSQVDNAEGLSRAVVSLGGRVTSDFNEMTHLVMTKPSRTMKMLQSLCVAKYIVKSSWLEESAKAGYFQLEDNYWVTELEGNFKCNIPAVVMSPTRKKLFQNRVFFITPSVIPGPSFLRWMIEQCGGKWEPNRRSIMKIHELNQQTPNSYIIISCNEDLHLLNFKHFVCYVCTSEFVLQSIMTQTIDFLRSELQLTR